ncbi:MAG: epoxyqueuosine reductase [Spirochaetaceae bacterium]|jgi:epoxyqueuosine reductase|nr:epoxyqueuosine reductase [Spirochaetaceae bacterium]
MSIEEEIRQKAYALGIEKLGIIKPEAMLDYADRLRERMERLPNGKALYGGFMGFADVQKNIPWAKSIIVAVFHYGHYIIPKDIGDRYGKSYLVDSRFNQDSPERQMLIAFEEHLHDLGIKTASNEHPGITAMRWAAYKAGLGIIRRNNFLYTEKGSWVGITAWAADKEMELIENHSLVECSENCNKCVKACPTASLSAPYTMNMATCVSRLSSSNDAASYDDETNRQMGGWMYGCNVCQEVCPMNKDKWEDTDVFPGLADIQRFLLPSQIIHLSYDDIEKHITPKFFYIKKESLWRWKLNAINAMVNDYKEEYLEDIQYALKDEYEVVREAARRALDTPVRFGYGKTMSNSTRFKEQGDDC